MISISDSVFLEAIVNTVEKNEQYSYRRILVWACKTLNLTLQQAKKMDWEELLLYFYEDKLSTMQKSELYDTIVESFPEFANHEEKEFDEFAEQALAEEQTKEKSQKTSTKEPELPILDINKTFNIEEDFS